MASYTRQSTFSDGDLITAELFNDEYNQLLAAFENTTGHKHDGTVGEGPVISIIGDAGLTTPLNKILIDTTNDHIEFWVDVSGTSTQQLYITDGAILPVTDNDIDLGSNSLQFKDLYINGTANIDTVDIDAGTIDGVTIGGSSAGAITGTTITATNFVIGSASIDETELEILDGATLTTTELNYVDGVTSSIQTQLNTKAPLSSPSLTGIPTAPTASANTNTTQIATTAYVQTEITDLIDAAPGTLDTLNELAAAINDDANYNTTLTTALATKLPLAGGTMTGNVTYSDNVKAQFGTSQDLQIYHDGSHSRLVDSGTGNFIIQAAQFRVNTSDDAEAMIKADVDGAVTLYHNGSAKLATTSSGIDVTGTITSSDNIFMSANGSILRNTGGALQLQSDASVVILRSNNTTALTLDTSQNATFAGTISSGAITSSGNVTLSSTAPLLYLTNTTSGTGKAWRFSSAANGKLFITQEGVIDAVTFDHTTGNATFAGAITTAKNDNTFTVQSTNAGQASVDIKNTEGHYRLITDAGELKVYDQTDSRTPFLINSSGNIGIGASSPTKTLHVMSGVSNDTVAIISGSQSDRGLTISTYASDGRTDGGVDLDAYKSFKFTTDGTERARINSSGQLLIGKTATDNTTAGTRIDGGGFISSVINGGAAILLNRLTSDGDIALFRKDGTTVGSIGTFGSDVYIGNNDSGLRFEYAGLNAVTPFDVNSLSSSDGATDLGYSNSRFKDLHLSGTANFGSLSDGTITITGFVDEDNMSSNSATLVPTQQSVKAYVDSQVSSAGGNGISFEDNEKAQFGDGNDLQIYHDGSHSYIKDAGTGNLQILATNFQLNNSANSQNMITASDGGAVTLFTAGSAKLATTSTGIDVTGTVTSDGLTVDGTISAYRAGFTQGVQLLGDSGGNQIIGTATNDKKLIIKNLAATQGIEIIAGNKVMDIARGGDISFYDDTGSTQGFFWDASAESLGIGTTSPSRTLHIKDAVAGIRLEDSDGTSYGEIIYNEGSNGLLIRSDENNADSGSNIIFEVDGAESSRIDSSGNIGIGTTSPDYAVDIRDDSNIQLKLSSTTTTNNARMTYAINNQQKWNHGVQAFDSSFTFYDIVTASTPFKIEQGAATNSLFVKSDGKIGIGTSSIDAKLHVESSSDTFLRVEKTGADNLNLIATGAGSRVRGSGDLIFDTGGGNERARIKGSNGYFGIGTSSPSLRLHSKDTGNYQLDLDSGGTRWRMGAGWSGFHQNSFLLADTANGIRMAIDTSGNVGIGTTSPDTLLHLSANTGATLRLESTDTAIAANEVMGAIEWEGNDATTGSSGIAGKIDVITEDATPEYSMRFFTQDNLSGTYELAERMRIKSDGKVGIGTSSPSATLEIATSATTNIDVAHFSNSNGAVKAKFHLAATSGDGQLTLYDGNNNADVLISSVGNSYINSGGNVGVGTDSPARNFHVHASNFTDLHLTNDTTGATASDGTSFTAIGSDIYLTNREAGNMVFQTSGTERARIDASGNLAIGNVSAAAKLDIRQDSGAAIRCEDGSGAYFVVKQGGTVGIGTPSPDAPLTVHNSSDPEIRFGYSSTQDHKIAWDSSKVFIHADPENANGSSAIGFAVDGSEAARFDSSGNLLVGTTSGGNSSAGFRAYAGGNGAFTIAGTALNLNRLSSNGEILSLQKDTIAVGSIGTINGDINIGTGDTGFRFHDGSDYIEPFNISTNSFRDNAISLGTTGSRFKDLHLSGTAFVDAINADGSTVYYSGTKLRTGSTSESQAGVSINTSTTGTGYLLFGDGTGASAYVGQIAYAHSDNSMQFRTAGSERARIDASGNVIFGKTSVDAGATQGFEFRADLNDLLYLARAGNAITLNRLSSDGDIALFRKDGTTVGSIGASSGDIYIGTGDTGLKFNDSLNNIYAWNTSTNTVRDGFTDLGATTARFKDLHLSGTVNASLGYFSKSGGNNITINSTTANATSLKLQNSARLYSINTTYDGNLTFYDGTATSERARFDTSGNLLVGKSSAGATNTAGHELKANGIAVHTTDNTTTMYLNRKTSDGVLIELRRDNVAKAQIGILSASSGYDAYFSSGSSSTTGVGLRFIDVTTTNAILPCRGDGTTSDNLIDLGSTANRFDDIYATNGTIQTSDRNDKQDIQALTAAEQRVATACKGLLRRFRWQDAVTEKGDEARYHFGIISQDLQDAFTAEGLDAGDYGMFISQTWEDSEGVEQTRLGVRYSELLAFIIAAI